MAAYSKETSQPLALHDIGPFGALFQRANPLGLVIVTYPLFESMLPLLEKKAGRKFTPAEVAAELAQAPAAALPKGEDERYITACRNGRRAQ